MINTIYVNPARHGSLQNAMLDQTRSQTPTVGMGATEIMFSDRHPYTIIKVLSPKRIVVQADKATRIDGNGCCEDQSYLFEPDPQAPPVTLFLNKRGKWKQLGDAQGSTFLLGTRQEYYDFTR